MKTKAERMMEWYERTHTLEIVGSKFGVTRERVRQIIEGQYHDRYVAARALKHKLAEERKAPKLFKCSSLTCINLTTRTYCSSKCAAETRNRLNASITSQKCVQCKEVKPIDAFHKRRYWNRDRSVLVIAHYSRCKKCWTQFTMGWRDANPERFKENNDRAVKAYKERLMSDPEKYALRLEQMKVSSKERYHAMKQDPQRYAEYLLKVREGFKRRYQAMRDDPEAFARYKERKRMQRINLLKDPVRAAALRARVKAWHLAKKSRNN